MADETPEKPRRRRRRRKGDSEAAPTPEAQGVSETEGTTEAADASASGADTTSEPAVDELEPTAEDEEAEDEAADVVLEAEDEVDGDTDAEVEDAGEGGAEEDEGEEAEAEEAEADEDEGEEAEAEAPEADEAEAEAPRRARRPRRRRQTEEPEPVAAPAPTRRRARRDPNLPPPVVRAQAKYVRSSARKARMVCDHIRGKTVEEARAILAHTPRAVARDWSKLLESAIANAENNHDLVGEDLYVKAIHADEGPTIKRFRPRALGRATRIRKRTSHLTILLTPKE
jgi:ribosomal protein L22